VTDRRDVVVVGAGPAGATTALLLARAGASVLLVDRARFPRDKACSEYLSPATTAILERLGGDVLGAVDGAAHAKLYGMKVVAPSGAAMCGRFRGDPRPFSFALPRTSFDSILVAAASRAGAEVCEGVAVDDLVWGGEGGRAVAGVMMRAGNGKRQTVRARVVVGADGLRSVVARRLGVIRTSPPRRIAFAAHVTDVAGVDGVGELHVSAHGYVGLGPVGGGITTVALVVPLHAVRRSGRDYRKDFFSELERFPGLAGRFDPRRLVRPVLATGPFAQWSRTAIASGGGALLVGDAADFFDPFTGQGIHSALRGAELAAETLVPALGGTGDPVPHAALRPYARARRGAFLGKWLLERLIGVGVGWPALTDRVVRRLARRPDLADLLVGATGNIVPARRVLAPGVLLQLLW
jgi:flavin-dependent dehydrogenase